MPRAVGAIRVVVAIILAAAVPPVAARSHPLDGLTLEEHRRAISLVGARGWLAADTVVAGVYLVEPAKARVLAGSTHDRRALVVMRIAGQVVEVTVDLVRGRLTRRPMRGVHSQFTDRDYEIATATALAAPEVRALLSAQDVDDPEAVECFATGSALGASASTRGDAAPRTMRVRCAERRGARSVAARVLEGVDVVVDVDQARVLHARDSGGSLRTEASPDPPSQVQRDGPVPSLVPARQGHGFTLEGGRVHWAGWRFHLRVDPRVGIMVSTVEIEDGDRRRSVLYQGHLSEIFVPYMDPSPGWYDRAVLDVAEYAYDGLAESLAIGIDCPREAAFMDGVTIDERGVPRLRPRVACLFERDTGIVAWRKGAENSESVEGRPTAELVVRMVSTIGNYDYIFDWIFQRDGVLRVAVGATGQLAVKVSEDVRHGRLVAERVVAVNHDHYFAFRLDVDVDGPLNSVVRMDRESLRLPGTHPRGAIWVAREHVVRSEAGVSALPPGHALGWRVVNPDARNTVGHPTGYELRMGHGLLPPPEVVALDPAHRRAGFVRHPLWVTPYRPGERYAAGDYPLLADVPDGLPAWTADDRNLERTDVVLWPVIGMHHVPRTEDWPLMPVLWHGIELRPFDFFDRNPALDLPDP